MRESQGHFAGAGGLELFYRRWMPEGEPRAVLVLVHGVGEHCGRYANVVGPLVEDGYAVYGYDHRGHGESPGRRVHIDRWDEYREDLIACLALVAGEMPGLPLIVYGHSMGSLIVLEYLVRRPSGLAGAIISGAAIEPAGVGKPYMVPLARALTGVAPTLAVSLGIDAGSLSRDLTVVEAYRSDPLVWPRATLRWGTESLDAVARVKQGMAGIDVPLLILHGESDPLNLVEGARALFDVVPHPDKTLRVYPGSFHEPHNDLDHDQLAADVKEWLARLTDAEARVKAPGRKSDPSEECTDVDHG